MSIAYLCGNNQEDIFAKLWLPASKVEQSAAQQIYETSQVPCVVGPVVVMPDVSYGIGATVGTVVKTDKAVIPAAIGNDIYCGMRAIALNIKRDDLRITPEELRAEIAEAIPHGRSNNGGAGDVGAWGVNNIHQYADLTWDWLTSANMISYDLRSMFLYDNKAAMQLGTLGGGNHFLEVCEDECGYLWIMVHSGSRGIGSRVAGHFIKKAHEMCSKFFVDLPNKNLAFLPEDTEEFRQYMAMLDWLSMYSMHSRRIMLDIVYEIIAQNTHKYVVPTELVDCHHNYTEVMKFKGKPMYVTRKGAISAQEGQYGIIPASMGRQSYIVRGKGCRDAYYSAPHGAGREMSRTAARSMLNLEEEAAKLDGVACDFSADYLEEAVGAYKDIDFIMECASDLVEVVHTLKQFVCVKGKDNG